MHIDRLDVGEYYSFLGKRCQILDKSMTSDGLAQVEIAHGRSFQHTAQLIAEEWEPMFIMDIGLQWDIHKNNQQALRECRRRARLMQERLDNLLGEQALDVSVDCDNPNSYGQIIIRGDLEKLQVIINQLQGLSAVEVDALQQLFANLVP